MFRVLNISLRAAIFGTFTLALLLILASLFFLVPDVVMRSLRKELQEKAVEIVQQIDRKLVLEGTDPDAAITEVIRDAIHGKEDDVALVAYFGNDGVVRSKSIGAEANAVEDAARRFLSKRPLSTDAIEVGDALGASKDFEPRYVVVQMSERRIREVIIDIRRRMLMAFVPGVLVFAVLGLLISRAFIGRPLNSMLAMASRISQSDLTGRMQGARSTEMTMLADALNSISQSLRDTLGRVRGVSEGVAQAIEQISRTGTGVSTGAHTVLARVEETSNSMSQMMVSLRGIGENVEVLNQSAAESSSSILEMAATNDQVAQNVVTMAQSVEETTRAISQMTESIKKVAQNVDQLLGSTEQTSTAMSQMDVAITQVETNANETARLSEQVTSDAETGVTALQKTIAGIDKIKESSRTALGVIETLERRISEIGNIVNVIDDVAEQTNLLALNAAIIAAQAGEHGKGFAVVADEIKELAERTGASTKEIAELIASVQEESRNAVAAMNQGVRNVEAGVLLGREAQTALIKISESANKSTHRVKAIAESTVEQARGSREVTEAIHQVAQGMQQISQATREQAKGSEQIIKSSERMKAITAHVQKSSQEQAHGSRQIIRSIENINEMVTHLHRAQKDQTQGSEQVLKAVEAIKVVSEQQSRSARQLEEAIDLLQRQAEVLRAEVRRFRV